MASPSRALSEQEQVHSSLPQVPENQIDRVLEMLRPLVEAVGRTVGSHCEVVLHDLRRPERSIVAISNGAVSGRRVGGPVIGGPTKDVALKTLDAKLKESTLSIGYKTETRDGRELRSTSLVMRTPEGKPVIAFCINVDLSTLIMAGRLLDDISKFTSADGERSTDDHTQTEVPEIIAQMIKEAVAEVGKPAKFMEREDRLHAVRLMHDRGLFFIRGGVERAADALGISRFTLYGYLKEIRSGQMEG